jgi:hypothetical protein
MVSAAASAADGLAVEPALRPAGRAFGLRLLTDFPISWVLGPHGAAAGTLRLRRAGPGAIDSAWDAAQPDRLLERFYPNGDLALTVDRDPAVGFLVHAPGHGRHFLAADGTDVLCELPSVARWRWHRLMFAQVMPLAATLQGLEVLHASAVVCDGRTLAFSGVQGAGKSSLAAHLVREGARHLTDDALALEVAGDRIVAHPGHRLANVHEHELDAVEAGNRKLGSRVATSDKAVLEVSLDDEPRELDEVYFIQRNEDVPEPVVEPLEPRDSWRLMANTFVAYVDDQRRLVRQLDTYSRFSATVGCNRLLVPKGGAASASAAVVRAHAAGR